jgi:hypothetical protein
MNLNDDVVYRCLRLGPLHQLHPNSSRSLVRYHDCLHRPNQPFNVWARLTVPVVIGPVVVSNTSLARFLRGV